MKCKGCGSSQVRTRIKTRDRICNKCGFTWAIEDTAVAPEKQTKKVESNPDFNF